jgi:hypothetical protein
MYRQVILLTMCLLLTSSVSATTHVIRPDGSGDFPTIQAAIDAAASGDVIELTDGSFEGDGNRDMDYLGKAITIRSQSGNPQSCVVDVQGAPGEPHRAFRFHSGEGSAAVLSGIGFRGGWIEDEPYGAALLCEGECAPGIIACVFSENANGAVACIEGASPTFTDCLFTMNHGIQGGAAYSEWGAPSFTRCEFAHNSAECFGGAFYGYAGQADFTDCYFRENEAHAAGAVHLIVSGPNTFVGCLFELNSASEHGAAFVFFAETSFDWCTFVANHADHYGGALSLGKTAHVDMTNCTLFANGSPDGTILVSEQDVVLDNCILASGTEGPAVSGEGDFTLTCCDLFGNAGGDWVDPIADQYGIRGNISEDPLFCDPEYGDFRLHENSPCAPFTPPNEECDLTGAHPVGCGPTAAQGMTWGAIKARFRQ